MNSTVNNINGRALSPVGSFLRPLNKNGFSRSVLMPTEIESSVLSWQLPDFVRVKQTYRHVAVQAGKARIVKSPHQKTGNDCHFSVPSRVRYPIVNFYFYIIFVKVV